MGKSTEKDKLEVPPVGHEESDVNFRAFLWFVVAFVIFAAVVHVGLWAFFRGMAHMTAESQKSEPTTLVTSGRPSQFPEPRLQSDPPTDMRDMLVEENQTLSTYGWVDQNRGVVRIPIDQAMKLAVQRGIYRANTGAAPVATPAQPQVNPAANAPAKTGVTAPGDVAQTTGK